MKQQHENHIYLDNQATTPVDNRVVEAMLPYLKEEYGNPHSNSHWFGWQAKKAVDAARGKVADFVGVDPDEIIFTSGATEANNLAIIGLLQHLEVTNKRRIVVSSFEHKCVLEASRYAASKGFDITYLDPNEDGIITPDNLRQNVDPTVGLVSIMTVNNEIGTIQPIHNLSQIAKDCGALFHTDAAQAGLQDLAQDCTNVDLLSLSGHKIYGPKGIGALYIQREIQQYMSPLFHGGGQEGGLRSGTLPTMLCVGFGEACKIISAERTEVSEHLRELSKFFWQELSKEIPHIKLNGSAVNRHPGNLNILFPGYDAESILQSLQPKLAASTGSACTSGVIGPSHVLQSIGLTHEEAASSIRFSFGRINKREEILNAIAILKAASQKLAA